MGKSPKKIYKVEDPYRTNQPSQGRNSLYTRPKESKYRQGHSEKFNKTGETGKKNEPESGKKQGGNLIKNMEGNSDIGDGKSHQAYGEQGQDNGSLNEFFDSIMSQSGQMAESRDNSLFVSESLNSGKLSTFRA